MVLEGKAVTILHTEDWNRVFNNNLPWGWSCGCGLWRGRVRGRRTVPASCWTRYKDPSTQRALICIQPTWWWWIRYQCVLPRTWTNCTIWRRSVPRTHGCAWWWGGGWVIRVRSRVWGWGMREVGVWVARLGHVCRIALWNVKDKE